MKNLKMLLAVAGIAGAVTLSACSSSRKNTAEVKQPPQTTVVESVQTAPPAYTMANLGASSSGRAR